MPLHCDEQWTKSALTVNYQWLYVILTLSVTLSVLSQWICHWPLVRNQFVIHTFTDIRRCNPCINFSYNKDFNQNICLLFSFTKICFNNWYEDCWISDFYQLTQNPKVCPQTNCVDHTIIYHQRTLRPYYTKVGV
jgi:hypothetical protein